MFSLAVNMPDPQWQQIENQFRSQNQGQVEHPHIEDASEWEHKVGHGGCPAKVHNDYSEPIGREPQNVLEDSADWTTNNAEN